ncbi:MAG: polysaccharide deacetylase family protein [Lewinellaceae bacterium]|nr:polysaccharide deacetylase family protein [Lewinellaceae bacterium]
MQSVSPPVIYYHSVAPKPDPQWVLHFLTMELAAFEDQLAYLRSRQFRGVFFEEWLAFRKGEKKVTGAEVCLAFDDGLLDNWVYAYPLIKKYGLRFTLFVSPECVDPRPVVRPTLEDVWAGRCQAGDLDARGYISWDELRLMQASGVVDIQSHTMSHDKYTVSDHLRGFYYGGFSGFYPSWNAFPDKKPFYMADPNFEHWLPSGTPLFEEASAVIARKQTINPVFFEETAAQAQKYALEMPDQRAAYEAAARRLHRQYQESGTLIAEVESEADYRKRLAYEVEASKKIIEEKLAKSVQFLCWPHGDNTHEAHALALRLGYLATTAGKMIDEAGQPDRIPRFGAMWSLGPWLNRRKFHYKIASHFQKQPYYSLWLANEFKNKILKRS